MLTPNHIAVYTVQYIRLHVLADVFPDAEEGHVGQTEHGAERELGVVHASDGSNVVQAMVLVKPLRRRKQC